jgi:hypothetical protein
MRELTEATDLCLANGRLNPAAVGYTRSPRHRTHLRGWGGRGSEPLVSLR